MLRLRQFFTAPFLALGVLNLALTWSSPRHPGSEEASVFFGGFVIATFDFYALTWLGTLAGLRETRYARAVLRTLGAVMVGPWLAVLLFMFSSPRQSSAVLSFFLFWFLVAALYDLALAQWAKGQLSSRFRELAANELRPQRALVERPIYTTALFQSGAINPPPPIPPSVS